MQWHLGGWHTLSVREAGGPPLVCFSVDDLSQLDITPAGPQLRGMGLALSGGRPFWAVKRSGFYVHYAS